MLYSVWRGHASWNGGQDFVAHLVARVSRLRALGQRVVFTDSNAATTYAIASEDFTQLATLVDWSVMPQTAWAGTAKGPRQAELLVATHVPWSVIDRIVVKDTAAQIAARTALGGVPSPPVDVDPTWYYP